MITLRVMAGAYLSNGEDMLLLKRAENRSFAPGLWACVGGHVEPHEINNPQTACLREILEETGIHEHNVAALALKYIVLRRDADEIRVSYIYFGQVNTREFIDSDEGRLHWINQKDLLNRPMSSMNRLVLNHYIENGETDTVLVGTLINTDGTLHITWMPLSSWEGL